MGYVGHSMSERAEEAYEDGEMPKSKWTKKAMLRAIEDYLNEMDRVCELDLGNLKKAELFERFFDYSSWHHTSYMFNETDFYSIDEVAIEEASRPMTDAERAERDVRHAANEEVLRALDESTRRKAREREDRHNRYKDLCALVRDKTGFSWGTVSAYIALFPDRVLSSHVSKRGNNVIRICTPDGRELDVVGDLEYSQPSWLDSSNDDTVKAMLAVLKRGKDLTAENNSRDTPMSLAGEVKGVQASCDKLDRVGTSNTKSEER